MLTFIKKEFILLDEGGILKRDNLIALIKKNQKYNNIKYKLLSILRFNINLEPEEVNKFISTSYNSTEKCRFLSSEKYLNDIKYSSTINIFQDLNSLYFIFYEEKEKQHQLQQHQLQQHQLQQHQLQQHQQHINNHTSTKKIIKLNSNKKTRRVRLQTSK
jgi:hypothetical protein